MAVFLSRPALLCVAAVGVGVLVLCLFLWQQRGRRRVRLAAAGECAPGVATLVNVLNAVVDTLNQLLKSLNFNEADECLACLPPGVFPLLSFHVPSEVPACSDVVVSVAAVSTAEAPIGVTVLTDLRITGAFGAANSAVGGTDDCLRLYAYSQPGKGIECSLGTVKVTCPLQVSLAKGGKTCTFDPMSVAFEWKEATLTLAYAVDVDLLNRDKGVTFPDALVPSLTFSRFAPALGGDPVVTHGSLTTSTECPFSWKTVACQKALQLAFNSAIASETGVDAVRDFVNHDVLGAAAFQDVVLGVLNGALSRKSSVRPCKDTACRLPSREAPPPIPLWKTSLLGTRRGVALLASGAAAWGHGGPSTCAAAEYVAAGACAPCPAGSDTKGGRTLAQCACPLDFRVASNACAACPANAYRAAGDLVPGTSADTFCACRADYRVNGSGACEACPGSSSRPAGDPAPSDPTYCACPPDHYFDSQTAEGCLACPAGSEKPAGASAPRRGSAPDPCTCKKDYHLHNKTCAACAFNTFRGAGDAVGGADTVCAPGPPVSGIIPVCKAVPAGAANPAVLTKDCYCPPGSLGDMEDTAAQVCKAGNVCVATSAYVGFDPAAFYDKAKKEWKEVAGYGPWGGSLVQPSPSKSAGAPQPRKVDQGACGYTVTDGGGNDLRSRGEGPEGGLSGGPLYPCWPIASGASADASSQARQGKRMYSFANVGTAPSADPKDGSLATGCRYVNPDAAHHCASFKCFDPKAPAKSPFACLPNPCLNGGACVPDGSGGYACACAPGYSGPDCGAAGPCTSQPCENGGTCVPDGTGGYACTCAEGYSGRDCDAHDDACVPNPCLHGGACAPGGKGGRTCTCAGGYTGPECAQADPCHEYSGCDANGGTCATDPGLKNPDGSLRAFCNCPPGYTSERADCAQSLCTYRSAKSGYVGKYDNVHPDPCNNRGTCSIDVDGGAHCACPSPWAGQPTNPTEPWLGNAGCSKSCAGSCRKKGYDPAAGPCGLLKPCEDGDDKTKVGVCCSNVYPHQRCSPGVNRPEECTWTAGSDSYINDRTCGKAGAAANAGGCTSSSPGGGGSLCEWVCDDAPAPPSVSLAAAERAPLAACPTGSLTAACAGDCDASCATGCGCVATSHACDDLKPIVNAYLGQQQQLLNDVVSGALLDFSPQIAAELTAELNKMGQYPDGSFVKFKQWGSEYHINLFVENVHLSGLENVVIGDLAVHDVTLTKCAPLELTFAAEADIEFTRLSFGPPMKKCAGGVCLADPVSEPNNCDAGVGAHSCVVSPTDSSASGYAGRPTNGPCPKTRFGDLSCGAGFYCCNDVYGLHGSQRAPFVPNDPGRTYCVECEDRMHSIFVPWSMTACVPTTHYEACSNVNMWTASASHFDDDLGSANMGPDKFLPKCSFHISCPGCSLLRLIPNMTLVGTIGFFANVKATLRVEGRVGVPAKCNPFADAQSCMPCLSLSVAQIVNPVVTPSQFNFSPTTALTNVGWLLFNAFGGVEPIMGAMAAALGVAGCDTTAPMKDVMGCIATSAIGAKVNPVLLGLLQTALAAVPLAPCAAET